MGNYNPRSPLIIGEEWAPIRDENLTFSPAVNVVERGHGFTLAQSRALQDARFYLNDFPPGGIDNQVYMASVYPAGQEAMTGPIRRVVIPVNAVDVTGTGFGLTLNAATNLEALSQPGDTFAMTVQPNIAPLGFKTVNLFFAVNQYAQALQGKRIVGVNFLYQLTWDPVLSGSPGTIADDNVIYNSSQSFTLEGGTGALVQFEYAPGVGTYGSTVRQIARTIGQPGAATEIDKISFGEINMAWQTPIAPTTTTTKMPWRFAELQRFERTANPNMRVHFDFGASNQWVGIYYLGYAAIEVLYCEETRVAYGGKLFGNGTSTRRPYVLGTNPIPLYSPTTFTTNPVIPAGAYTTTISSADIGDLNGPFTVDISRPAQDNTYPSLNALRELYAMPQHPGVQVNVTQKVGATFTSESVNILPQLSLHTTGGAPLTEVHVYGRQAAAQVYGSITATQEVYDDISGVAASYPQVRYYARRFGWTTVPLTLSGTGTLTASTVSITPSAFDALPEIVDGWKEVTLRFPIAPSLGAVTGTPGFTWSASGETPGNRWEILGACAPAISGIPGNFLNLAPPTEALSAATYQPPAGATTELTWMPQGIGSPPVSGQTSDATTDGVLMFSQDPPTITGMALSPSSQAVTGFVECGSGPCCIPTAIAYHTITWPARTLNVLNDTFTRAAASGTWGTATSGQTWSLGVPAVYSLNGTAGLITPAATNTYYTTLINPSLVDITGSFRVSSSIAATGSDHWTALTMRSVTTTDQLYVRVGFETNGTVTFFLSNVTASVHTTLATMVAFSSYTPGTWINVKFSLIGQRFQGKIWKDEETEPAYYTLNAQVTANLVAGQLGTRSIVGTGGTIPVISMDSIQVSDVTSFGYFELQRQDIVDPVWRTIMKATSPYAFTFNDYEARVGVMSSYRIRQANQLNFIGPWSTTITGTIAEPGVTMPSCGTNKRGILIFTSNASQTGAYNLAYAMTWEGGVSEDFQFPEASGVEFTEQFDRDFQVAFHGTERGGEVFSRTLLLANAAVALPRLANVKSLRDMAWADLPYVCVRDDIGDRWLAAVTVPGDSVRRKRRLYNAPITVTETTNTPSPVNP